MYIIKRVQWLSLLIYIGIIYAHAMPEVIIEKQNLETTRFYVDVADTYSKRKEGLMYVKSIPKDHGMLFVFDNEAKVSMWMKNTFIPLDMIFIDEKGTITEIVERSDTRSRTATTSKKPVKYVLEINLGEAEKQGIKVGDKVKLPV